LRRFFLAVTLAVACMGQLRAATSNDWLMYNGSYAGDRYSTLAQIDRRNAGSLHLVCALQLGVLGAMQTGPVISGGTMYVTTNDSTFAVDARTCRQIWKHTWGTTPSTLANRGVALLDGKLFRGTPDAHLIAIDAATGKTVWDTQLADPASGVRTIGAPVAWNGKVFFGLAGSEYGMKGKIMAFAADDGKLLWTFDVIPTGNQPGAETWGNAAATATGGGGTWSSATIDTTTGTLFFPIGNPGPDYAPDYRPGANLYTNSIVALDTQTGNLRWYYQLTPHDFHDWDAAAAPALFTGPQGKPLIAFAGKNGYLYSLDLATHQVVTKVAVTTIQNADAPLTAAGTHFCPGTFGGVEWNGPSYSPRDRLLYVNSIDWCTTIQAGEVRFIRGQAFLGSNNGNGVNDPEGSGWLNAVDPQSGKIAWRYHSSSPMVAAVTTTAGGVLFTGEGTGSFDAFDSADGKLLYQFNTGGAVAGGIATYAVAGKQYVAVTSGNRSRTGLAAAGSPTIFVFSL
jgi:alcohol dehydrogenase (cytochrome c)